jgi:hypothetical protein
LSLEELPRGQKSNIVLAPTVYLVGGRKEQNIG